LAALPCQSESFSYLSNSHSSFPSTYDKFHHLDSLFTVQFNQLLAWVPITVAAVLLIGTAYTINTSVTPMARP